jgi:hypothetical protein
VPFGARQQERIRRGAQGELHPVQLHAGSTAADEAEVADPLIRPDALEDERGPRIEAVLPAHVVGADVEALGGEADAAYDVRRAAEAPPQPTVLATERMVVLAGMRSPGPDAVLGAADLDDARQRRLIGDSPVPAVGADVDETAATVEPRLHGIPHRGRVIFGVGAGDDHAVGGERVEAFIVQILVGDHIEGKSFVLEPVGQVRVGIELPQPRAGAADPGAVFGAHVEDRPQARGVADAAAVGVQVVKRGAVLDVLMPEQIRGLKYQKAADDHLRRFGVQMLLMIGVRYVGRRRREEGKLRSTLAPCRAARRTDKERDVVLAGAVLRLAIRPLDHQVGGIDSALHVRGHGEGKVASPSRIVEVVVVEMDRAVVFELSPPALLLAGPVPALHGAGGQVGHVAVQTEGAGVERPRGRDLAREVKGQQEAVADRRRHRPQEDAVQLACR